MKAYRGYQYVRKSVASASRASAASPSWAATITLQWVVACRPAADAGGGWGSEAGMGVLYRTAAAVGRLAFALRFAFGN
jgi:hypothetical protein